MIDCKPNHRWHLVRLTSAFLLAVLALSGCADDRSDTAYSPHQTVSSSENAEVIKSIQTINLHRGIESIAWHPNEKILAVGLTGLASISLVDRETSKVVGEIKANLRPLSKSGRDAIFSPDGRFLVVKNIPATIPQALAETKSHPAQHAKYYDQEGIEFGLILEYPSLKQIGVLRGRHSESFRGIKDMCFFGNQHTHLAVLDGTGVAVYSIPDGRQVKIVDLAFPFKQAKHVKKGYWRMACHPHKSEVALEGSQFFDDAVELGFEPNAGVTPIVVADMNRGVLKQILISNTPLNGVGYGANGDYIYSYGKDVIRIWSTRDGYPYHSTVANSLSKPRLTHRNEASSAVLQQMQYKNVGELQSVPHSNYAIGISHGVQIWNLVEGFSFGNVFELNESFRLAVSPNSGLVAVNSRNFLHILTVTAKR
jgi:WD40 repeat protein